MTDPLQHRAFSCFTRGANLAKLAIFQSTWVSGLVTFSPEQHQVGAELQRTAPDEGLWCWQNIKQGLWWVFSTIPQHQSGDGFYCGSAKGRGDTLTTQSTQRDLLPRGDKLHICDGTAGKLMLLTIKTFYNCHLQSQKQTSSHVSLFDC